jgi:hypothetical protein
MNELTGPQMDVLEAVIKERLRRLLMAQDQLCSELWNCETDELRAPDYAETVSRIQNSVCQRHDIPILALHPDVAENCSSKFAIVQAEKYIRKWVRGKMSKAEIEVSIVGPAMELEEYDYGWVFLDKPMGFYTRDLVCIEEIDKEIGDIGSRNSHYTPPEDKQRGLVSMLAMVNRSISTKKFFQMMAGASDVAKAGALREALV